MRLTARKVVLGLALLLALGVLGAGGIYLYLQASRPTLASLGGTILVYEMDGKPPRGFQPDDLAAALQRRLDPNGVDGITVAPAGPLRVEIVVPRVGNHGEHLQDIKALLRQAGHLEFRILANGTDDADAISDARELLNPNNLLVGPALQEAQNKGLPPPVPHTQGLEGELRRYTIHFPNKAESMVTYSWVELSPQERRALNLDNAARSDPTRNELWFQLDRARGQALQLMPSKALAIGPVLAGALFYSTRPL